MTTELATPRAITAFEIDRECTQIAARMIAGVATPKDKERYQWLLTARRSSLFNQPKVKRIKHVIHKYHAEQNR